MDVVEASVWAKILFLPDQFVLETDDFVCRSVGFFGRATFVSQFVRVCKSVNVFGFASRIPIVV